MAEMIIEPRISKTCSACEEDLPVENFTIIKNKYYANGDSVRMTKCKPCWNAWRKKKYAEDKEWRERHSQSCKKNRENEKVRAETDDEVAHMVNERAKRRGIRHAERMQNDEDYRNQRRENNRRFFKRQTEKAKKTLDKRVK